MIESLRGIEPRAIRHLSLADRVGLFQQKMEVFAVKLTGQDAANYRALIDLTLMSYASQTPEFKEDYEKRAHRMMDLLQESDNKETGRALEIMPWVELLCFRPEVEEMIRTSPANAGHAKIK